MKKIALVALSVLVVALVGSCQAIGDLAAAWAMDGRTKPFVSLGGESGQGDMAGRLDLLAGTARDMGWKDAAGPAGWLEGSGEGLGYRIVRAGTSAAIAESVAWSDADRDKLLADLDKRQAAYRVFPLYHCRPWLDRDSPLPRAAEAWTNAQLGEWLAWEWAARTLMGRDRTQASKVAWAAQAVNGVLVARMQGQDSPELARWKEGVRDRTTFNKLLADVAGQVAGIIEAHPDAGDRDKVMKRILWTWFNNYQQQYSTRFLTNQYADFGKTGYEEPLYILGIERETTDWGRLAADIALDAARVPQFIEALRGYK